MLYFRSIIALTALVMVSDASASIVWTGASTTFTKENYADHLLPVNQDFLTSNVSLTRADYGGLCNVTAGDPCYGSNGVYYDPGDTEWADGSIGDWHTLTYDTLRSTVKDAFDGFVWVEGETLVGHLVTDDVYFELTFLIWQIEEEGGGFSYTRTTPNAVTVPEPPVLLLFGTGLLGLIGVRWRRKSH
jgi:hypothetical protein